jgi:hypothetical protein
VETVIRTRFDWQRPLLLTLIAIAAFAVVMFGLRTYRSFLLLRSAYELGAPDVSSVRPWMTLDYVAPTYRVPGTALAERLGLPPDIDPQNNLEISCREARLVTVSIYPAGPESDLGVALHLITPRREGNGRRIEHTW